MLHRAVRKTLANALINIIKSKYLCIIALISAWHCPNKNFLNKHASDHFTL